METEENIEILCQLMEMGEIEIANVKVKFCRQK